MSEYLRWSLREALNRSSTRVVDLFRQWDDDGSGSISKKEFRRAIMALGFDFFDDVSEIDKVFDEFDTDGSGEIDYKELNKMLRQSVKLDDKLYAGAAGEIKTKAQTKHKLRKGPRGKASALPNSVKLSANSDQTVAEQLHELLAANSVRVIDIFRSWDEDGSGSIDKKEFREAISALGFDAPKADKDAVFEQFDADGSGAIDLKELKNALKKKESTLDPSLLPGGAGVIELTAKNKSMSSSKKNVGMRKPSIIAVSSKRLAAKGKDAGGKLQKSPKAARPPMPPKKMSSSALESDDVAGDGDEDFGRVMNRKAQDYEAADADGDNQLDFDEFCAMVRNGEERASSRTRSCWSASSFWTKMAPARWICPSICAGRCASRSTSRPLAWWISSASGTTTARDRSARRSSVARSWRWASTFSTTCRRSTRCSTEFDTDGSGEIDYKELNKMLRQSVKLDDKLYAGAAGEIKTKAETKHKLRKAPSGKAGLAQTIKLKTDSKQNVVEQLQNVIAANAIRVIDIFQTWDEDGSGTISKKEFRKAVAALGYDAPKADVDRVFDIMDEDSSGEISLKELKHVLSRRIELDPSLLPGGAGEIELSAKNASSTGGGAAAAKGKKGGAASGGKGGGYAAKAPAAKASGAKRGGGYDDNDGDVTDDSVPPARPPPQAASRAEPAPPPRAPAQPRKAAPRGRPIPGEPGGDPYEDVQLLLEAAPLPLRVVGMPTGEGRKRGTTSEARPLTSCRCSKVRRRSRSLSVSCARSWTGCWWAA